jgi:hypothetical protein
VWNDTTGDPPTKRVIFLAASALVLTAFLPEQADAQGHG